MQIEGRNPVVELLRGQRRVKKIYLQQGVKGNNIDWIIKKAEDNSISFQRVTKTRLNKMASSHSHQGVIAIAEQVRLYEPEAILNLAREKDEPPFVVVLDQIQDPHNFGAIMRTAYAAGVHGIIYPKNRAVDITPVVVKSSAGAVEHLMLAKVTNINYTIKDLKEAGLWIAGTDIEEAQLCYDTDLKGPLAIVIGNEGTGLRRLVKENCDFLVKIPMQGKLGSLNASVAAGIVIFEAVRQRRQI